MHGTSIFSQIFIKNDSLMKYVNIGIGPKRGVECLNAPEFYEQELQLSVQEIFRIERVLKYLSSGYLSSGKVTVTSSIRGYH